MESELPEEGLHHHSKETLQVNLRLRAKSEDSPLRAAPGATGRSRREGPSGGHFTVACFPGLRASSPRFSLDPNRSLTPTPSTGVNTHKLYSDTAPLREITATTHAVGRALSAVHALTRFGFSTPVMEGLRPDHLLVSCATTIWIWVYLFQKLVVLITTLPYLLTPAPDPGDTGPSAPGGPPPHSLTSCKAGVGSFVTRREIGGKLGRPGF